MVFVEELGYHEGVTPRDETSHKHLKLLIDTLLFMEAQIKEEMKVAFGTSLIHSIFLLLSWLFIMCLLW